jgi:hypothetical protein
MPREGWPMANLRAAVARHKEACARALHPAAKTCNGSGQCLAETHMPGCYRTLQLKGDS